jgi:hypothetical protein
MFKKIKDFLFNYKIKKLNKKINNGNLTLIEKLEILNNPKINESLNFPTIELTLPRNIIIHNTNNVFFTNPVRIGSSDTMIITSGENSGLHLNPPLHTFNIRKNKHVVDKNSLRHIDRLTLADMNK